MSLNRRVVDATAQEVWDVLADGWLYPLFVVGASRMREVDDSWPAVGARLHHSAGVWPVLIDDTTSVLDCDPRSRLRLQARGWPLGEATVTISLSRQGEQGVEVTIEEEPSAGPGTLLPRPVRDPVLGWRNVETLRRLAFVVERRAAGPR